MDPSIFCSTRCFSARWLQHLRWLSSNFDWIKSMHAPVFYLNRLFVQTDWVSGGPFNSQDVVKKLKIRFANWWAFQPFYPCKKLRTVPGLNPLGGGLCSVKHLADLSVYLSRLISFVKLSVTSTPLEQFENVFYSRFKHLGHLDWLQNNLTREKLNAYESNIDKNVLFLRMMEIILANLSCI